MKNLPWGPEGIIPVVYGNFRRKQQGKKGSGTQGMKKEDP